MTAVLSCLRCGHTGPDVAMRWPDLEREAHEQGERVRMVDVPIVEQMRHVSVTRVDTVPERYASSLEPRCVDNALCLARWRAASQPEQEAPATPAHAAPEVPRWLR